MTYAVTEIYYTLQGEGHHSGRPAVFARFAGCNLWNGQEADRASAICRFCDTEFVGTSGAGGGHYQTAQQLAETVVRFWPTPADGRGRPFVVCTGGEPLLQLDEDLIVALREREFDIAVETNGTLAAPPGLDWICVSPKAGAPLVQQSGDELKLVYPQEGLDPESFLGLDFLWFSLQPMDGPNRAHNTQLAVQYCLEHPRWRLSIQAHKVVGIP
jgi:7-carboxy-7-deazaguanine synthase (Cx14CxxC type)